MSLMQWDQAELNGWLDEQDLKWGDAEDQGLDFTKDEWLEWANSMQWDRAEWEEFTYEQNISDQEWQEWLNLM
jgi:hypothetical protein